jgi:uncharacterized protein (DUF1800 family)
MGQNLFAPPNVNGWPGGNLWISSDFLLARKRFLELVFRAERVDKPMIAQGPPMPHAFDKHVRGRESAP